MTVCRIGALVALSLGAVASAVAQPADTIPLENWSAPPYWTQAAGPQARQHIATATGGVAVSAESASPTTILPFTAVTPCRLYDSRPNAPFIGDSTFSQF